MSTIFKDCYVAIVGTFKGRKQSDIAQQIADNGGFIAETTGTTTHLVCKPADVARRGPKVQAALSGANGTAIVGLDWIDACIAAKKKVDEKPYLLVDLGSKDDEKKKDEDGDVEMGDSQTTNGGLRRSARTKASAEPSSQQSTTATTAVPAPMAGKKRGRKAESQQETVKEEAEEGEEEEKGKDVEMKDAAPSEEKKEQKDEEKEEEKPAKRARGRPKANAAAGTAAPATSKAPTPPPAPAPPAKRGRGGAKTAASQPDSSAVVPSASAPAAPTVPDTGASSAPAKRGRGKKKEPMSQPNEEDKDDEKEPTPEPPKKMKTVMMNKGGLAPVDECFPYKNEYAVYVDGNGVVYDGNLNQTDVRMNANKFYYVQLLEALGSVKTYATWTRWGRVGEVGQSSLVAGRGSNFHTALSQFNKKFKDKTGLNWVDRFSTPKPGKYTFIEKNYAESDGEEDDKKDSKKKKGKKDEEEEKDEAPPPSKLSQPLQDLIALIFNTSIMQQQMVSMSYDSNKLPLGKLSKSTLQRGYLVLKSIGDLINDPSSAMRVHGVSIDQAFVNLTNQYYSVIPHAFGRNVPPIIRNEAMLKKEVDLVESLGDMEIATEIIKNTKGPVDADGNRINQLDSQFLSLGLEEATPLEKSTTEFQNLKAYVQRTHGHTHGTKLTVVDIFRIERQGETARFSTAGYDKLPNDNRYLLWHGSRTTNFAGILSQGLRIAPPEAPVNGYMFGKGIYLADMVTKSANYCCAYASNNTGLLLLCEAQLGDPMFELTGSDYHASENSKKAGALATKGKGGTAPLKWMDAELVNESLKGVKMPDINADPGQTNEPGAYLAYNEYIVYDVSQVKIRYLFKCKFN